ncbi:sterile alpha motif domain-containing protein 11 isoform X2 [Stegostoma tigrinum]|uniref:sterile alpha motif domain-containing protein 11 isoform X2 n=1 Tax=Stegostoma tigrinum TaxID=3053191 RepID=UPI00202B59BB|nr:sterile alpha motif domain-containing protein 11 isoform X2 [Stegostoma tigrinum]
MSGTEKQIRQAGEVGVLDPIKTDKSCLVEGWGYHRSKLFLHFNGCFKYEKLQREELIAGVLSKDKGLLMRMPAIKKERADREGVIRGLLDGLPEFLAPLNAASVPVLSSHPPPYEHLYSPARRPFLGLQEARHPEELLLERVSSIPDFQPVFDNGQPCIEVECGDNRALLYIHKLCQGSKGPSIRYRGEWLTPNEFQFVSGRETAKDWKRSIRHKGKSLKTLMSKGVLQVHPPICDCPGCRISSPVNRGRLAEKRTIPLPPTRVPKKELTSAFTNSEDSKESEKANGDRPPEVKQEEEIQASTMKRRLDAYGQHTEQIFNPSACTAFELHPDPRGESRESDLSTIISNLHQSRQLVMPEGQSRNEIKKNGIDLLPGQADEILGKRRVCSPNNNSDCPEIKRQRSESPKEKCHTPLIEDQIMQMTPEEHYRRMMSALNEHGTYEEQQQRLYQLANSMGVPAHGDLLRARQEAVAAVRNSSAMEPHIPSSSSSSSQRRKQGLPQHRDAHFNEREMTHTNPLLSPQNAPHIALGPHLRPPFLGVHSTLCQTPGYGFLQPAQAEIFARQQEMLRKQNLARLEMSAELLRQKEFENMHRQRILGADPLSLHSSLPPDHPALRSIHDVPEGHPLREEISRRNAMLVLRHNTAPLLSLNHAVPGNAPPKEPGRKGTRKVAHHRTEAQCVGEVKDHLETCVRDGSADCNDEEMKDSESDPEAGDDKPENLKTEVISSVHELKECKETVKPCENIKEMHEASTAQNPPCVSVGSDSPSHLLGSGIVENKAKYLPSAPAPLPQPLPFGFPYTANPYFHTVASHWLFSNLREPPQSPVNFAGSIGSFLLDGEDGATVEDISKWTVDDVCNFINGLSGCAEYTQVFREQAIDGETLPLLTEEHLLNTMGLKLGPALKIRAQVAKRIGRVLYMASFPLPLALPPAALRPPERDLAPTENRPSSTGSVASPYCGLQVSRISPKQENGSASVMGIGDLTKPQS